MFEGKRDAYLDARGTIPAPEHATDALTRVHAVAGRLALAAVAQPSGVG